MLELKEIRKEETSKKRMLYRLMKAGKIKCYYGEDGAHMYDVAEYEAWARMHKKYGHCQRSENNGKQKETQHVSFESTRSAS